jgi:small-conductance mechanosensitive channel
VAAARRARSWWDAGLARRLSRRAVKRAQIKSLIVLPLIGLVLLLYSYRDNVLGEEWDTAARVVTAVALLSLGWQLARDAGRALAPTLYRHLDPGTAGTADFMLRLVTMLTAVVVAARVAGLSPATLALGGVLTAVVVGLAAQQTLGHMIAGLVLLSARSFRVGERVRLQGGGLAGTLEGVVSSLGLLYTTLATEDGPTLVPNAVVLSVAVMPLSTPDGVDVRARLPAGMTPADVQDLLQRKLETPLRGPPRITLEEVDGDDVVVQIHARPQRPSDGPRLAGEVVRAVEAESGTIREAA